MLVHLLNALTEWPLWLCYGIIGGVCAIAGVVLLYRGKQHISQIDMVPQQTVETMKENVRWIKKKATSEQI
jgi:molybdate-binding protein